MGSGIISFSTEGSGAFLGERAADIHLPSALVFLNHTVPEGLVF